MGEILLVQMARGPEEDNDYMLKMLSSPMSSNCWSPRMAKKGSTIPIVFVAGEDPVTLGLMTSLARSSGNLTGIQRPRQALQ
jgi:ABC-type uncharacterized transport system substrate-binding protein